MKKIFLIGYYGYNNFGDELLLNASLKIIEDIGFKGEIYIPAGNELFLYKDYPFNIITFNRYDFNSIKKYISNSNIVIFGGGNIFQSKTSFRSFLYYYYFIAKRAMKNKVPIVLISQGFGPIRHKIAKKLLKKLLNYKKLFGIYRERTSFNYAKKFNKNSYLGVDIGPYTLDKDNLTKEYKISLCLKDEKKDLYELVNFLNIFDNYEISTVIMNSQQDSSISYKIVEELRKHTNLEVKLPLKKFFNIQKELSSSEIIVSDRLHSSLLGLYYGKKILAFNSSKNRRVLKNISMDFHYLYNSFKDIAGVYSKIIQENYNFEEISQIYNSKLIDTINITKNVIQNVL